VVRWRKVMAVAGLLLAGAAFGPALSGGLATRSWVEAADGNTAVGVVSRMYDRLYPAPVGLVYSSPGPDDTELGLSCYPNYETMMLSGEDRDHMTLVLIRQNALQWYYSDLKRQPAEDALLALPRPLLGALDSCTGSAPILSDFCRAYAITVMEKAIAEQVKKRAEVLGNVRRQNEAIWCSRARDAPAKTR